jgi:hypothetical protein
MENGLNYPPRARFWYFIYFFVARLANFSKTYQTKISRFGEISAFVRFIQRTYPKVNIRVFNSKDSLRKVVINYVKRSKLEVVVFEFGVATGSGTRWLLKQFGSNLLKFYGFDRFTGLPRSWRGLKEGHFTNGGVPPTIQDSRITWFVGDAETTLAENFSNIPELQMPSSNPKFIIFDMDILEPTLDVYNLLKPSLRKGDWVLFDEAFDSENELIVLKIFLSDFNTELIGITSEAALCRII